MTFPDFADVPSAIGTFRIFYQGRKVSDVALRESPGTSDGVRAGLRQHFPPFPEGSPPWQLQEYFLGRLSRFDVEPEPVSGSSFDRSVWKVLFAVPAGRTVTYGELARRAGFSGSARAVGGAMHRNPIPIIVPCHRVVGSDGSITGFGLGLWRKRWLLGHEGSWPVRPRSLAGPAPSGQRTLDDSWASVHRLAPISKAAPMRSAFTG
jgi:methylated-DNA-[protein]-cysteine S-methyltransferase